MAFIDGIKRRLHRDIVADPVLHGLVLNLYLNGEAYPHRVEDYFPIAAVDEPELAAAMSAHAKDEDKHVALYARAIEKMGQSVLDLPMDDIFNEVIRKRTPASFAMSDTDTRDGRRRKLAHFLAHAHFLEKRVAKSLEYHIEACAHSATPYAEKAVGAVLSDESRHVGYTREAVMDLLPRTEALETLALHERAETLANLDFSISQLSKLLREHSRRFSVGSRWIHRGCVAVMQRWVAYA
jgi:hypothetical protein